jgi:hypothetical protein
MSGAESDGLLTPKKKRELPPELRRKIALQSIAGRTQVTVMSPRAASTPCVTLPSIRSKHSLAAVVSPSIALSTKVRATMRSFLTFSPVVSLTSFYFEFAARSSLPRAPVPESCPGCASCAALPTMRSW